MIGRKAPCRHPPLPLAVCLLQQHLSSTADEWLHPELLAEMSRRLKRIHGNRSQRRVPAWKRRSPIAAFGRKRRSEDWQVCDKSSPCEPFCVCVQEIYAALWLLTETEPFLGLTVHFPHPTKQRVQRSLVLGVGRTVALLCGFSY